MVPLESPTPGGASRWLSPPRSCLWKRREGDLHTASASAVWSNTVPWGWGMRMLQANSTQPQETDVSCSRSSPRCLSSFDGCSFAGGPKPTEPAASAVPQRLGDPQSHRRYPEPGLRAEGRAARESPPPGTSRGPAAHREALCRGQRRDHPRGLELRRRASGLHLQTRRANALQRLLPSLHPRALRERAADPSRGLHHLSPRASGYAQGLAPRRTKGR